MSDPFFSKTKCDRCGGPLPARQMSWFTEETLCVSKCIPAERELRTALERAGWNTRTLEGCGYIPAHPASKNDTPSKSSTGSSQTA